MHQLARIVKLQADLTRIRNEDHPALGLKITLAMTTLGVMAAAGAVLIQRLFATVASLLGSPSEQTITWLAAAVLVASGFGFYGLIVSCVAPTQRSVYRERELMGELHRLDAILNNRHKR